jgi:bis(5'-adenosyl)-triphosphatase
VHFHLLPRKVSGDQFSGENNDTIYPALEIAEETLPDHLLMADSLRRRNKLDTHLKVDADDNRPARTLEEMEKEANWLKSLFALDAQS